MAAKPIKVSQLNGYIKRVLQMDPLLGNVAVSGEISNVKYHGNGHVYFTLKDENSKISCFLASGYLKDLHFQLTEGMQVICYGYVNVYDKGGTYSLNIRSIEADGVGSLAAAFEELKKRLSEKGYFDPTHKKKIPPFPNKVAIITSDTGAAIEDMLRVIRMRNNHVDILIVPCLVQGPNAAGDIADAIRTVNSDAPDVDVIIEGRGGGSLEELWPFNEEIVADAIYESIIPVISAVGHETDFTISDFVSDVRAQTPTEAAAISVPDLAELKKSMAQTHEEMNHRMEAYLDHLEYRMNRADIAALSESLIREIDSMTYAAFSLENEINHEMDRKLMLYDSFMKKHKETLDNLNPQSIMDKGYAALTDLNGILLTGTDQMQQGDEILMHLKDGNVLSEVKNIWRKQT